jgi:hypothetical protein
MVFHLEYGVTFGEHVAQSRRHALSREGSIAALTPSDQSPQAVSLSVINARAGSL